jgi:uncharacterized DUF497 family protein
MKFEWDSRKAAVNRQKHGVSFEEASTVFADPRAVEFFDDEHSTHEDRFITLAMSEKRRILMVVHTERSGDAIRIISARRATRSEANEYGQS